MMRRMTSGLRLNSGVRQGLHVVLACVMVLSQVVSAIPFAPPSFSSTEIANAASLIQDVPPENPPAPIPPADEPPPAPEPDSTGMFDDLPTVPAPQSEEAPPPSMPVAPGQLNLTASDYVFGKNQDVTLTLRVDDDGISNEGFALTLALPMSLTVVSSADGSLSQSGELHLLSWRLPRITGESPFERQVVVRADSGDAGDSFLVSTAIAQDGYETRGMSMLLGLGNLNNHELFVLLDPQTVAEGVTVVSSEITETLTGTLVSTVDAAGLDLWAMACGKDDVECWGAESSLRADEWIDLSEESAADPVDISLSESGQRVYLPVISSGGTTLDSELQARVEENPEGKNVKADFEDGGLALHKIWRINAKKLGQKLEALDRPATLIFSAKKLIKKGIDPASVRLWTRPDDAPANSLWDNVSLYYDASREVFVARTLHFSDWGLGDGLTSQGNYLPTTRSFSSDLFGGAATTSIGIEAPAGLGGMAPSFSLSYSSRQSDDIHNDSSSDSAYTTQGSWAGGYGWSLGGMSSISRSPDGFFMSLNGMALKLVWVSGNTWKTEPESYLKITHSTGCPAYVYYCEAEPWTVVTADGTTYQFGGLLATNGNRLVVSTYTAVVMENHNINGTWHSRQTGSKWYLREAVDTLGNRMDYTYETESTTFSAGCSTMRTGWPGGANPGDTQYTRATYLRQVLWSGHNLSGQANFLAPTMRLWFSRAARVTLEKQVNNWSNGCLQPQYSNERLSEILVQVRTGADWNTGNVHTLRRYLLSYGTSATLSLGGCVTNTPCHAMLTSVDVGAKDGGSGTLQSYSFTYTGSNNLIRMASANNGFGGVVTYGYVGESFWHNQQCFGTYNKCNRPYYVDVPRYFRNVSTIDTADGLGNSYRSAFSYSNARGFADSNGFEHMGHKVTTVSTYALNNTGTIVRQEEHFFHQLTASNTRDQRRGKEYQTVVWNGPKSANKRLQQVDSVWSDNSGWVRQDSAITTICDPNGANCVNKESKLFYNTVEQNGGQYGNPTLVEEYSNGSKIRATTTWYYPNTSAWIVSKPARVKVAGVGSDGSTWNSCLSEQRMVYDRYDSNYATQPVDGLLTEADQALSACDTANPINADTATSWAVQRMAYDAYGNKTVDHQYGDIAAQHIYVNTEYDTVFKLFPVRQYSSNMEETAKYYGVNGLAASDSKAFWGAMQEHCGVNGVCTRQSYDEFGRSKLRWDAIPGSSSGWGTDAEAALRWDYVKPNSKSYTGGTGPSTYVVTEWHAPRCLGGFVRSHYNGLGQLVMEQRPQQDWQYPFDGCGSSTVFNEVDTYYQYNSLGQQTQVSVPNPESSTNSANDTNIWWRRTASWSSGYSSATYDPIGRALSNVAPNGETTLHTYGAVGHATIQDSRDTTPNNFDKVVRWEAVDLYGQMNETRSYYWGDVGGVWDWRLDSKVVLTHDGLGNLTKVVRTSPDNVTLSTMNYDKAGRKLSMQDADLGGTMNNVNTGWRYQYDRQSNLIRQTDARNKTTCLYYEHAMGQLAGKQFRTDTSCPTVASFTNNHPNLSNSATYSLQYLYGQSGSSAGQLTNIDYIDNHWDKTITYNSKGQVSKESVTIAGTGLLSTTYQYDSYLRPWKTTYPDGEVLTSGYNSMGLPMTLTSGSSVVLVDSATYSVTGQLLGMRMPAGTSSTSDDVWRTQSYFSWTGSNGNSNGRLSTIKVGTTNGGNNRLNLSYSYDSFSNIKSITEGYNGGGTTANNFTYDAQNRLTNGYAKDYNYDAAGRMLKYEATSNNQTFNSTFPLHAIKNANYAYDLNGNMITRTVGSNLHSLTWDAENHLTSISGPGITTENYTYDADGNRVKKTVGSTNFYYPFPTYEISGTVAIKYYFFAGQRVAMKSGSTLTYLHGDHLGSTALATTSAGAWQSQEKYFAYGKDRDTANSVPTDHKFTGQKQDGSGLTFMNARYYDPQTGLFVSPDTLVPDAGNVFAYNRTMYVYGRVLNANDPTGHYAVCFQGGRTHEADPEASIGQMCQQLAEKRLLGRFGDARDYRVFAPDQNGIQAALKWIDGQKTADKGGTEPLILIGYSYGGGAALELSGKLNETGTPVDKLVTIDPVKATRSLLGFSDENLIGDTVYRFFLGVSVPDNVGDAVNFYADAKDIWPFDGETGVYGATNIRLDNVNHHSIMNSENSGGVYSGSSSAFSSSNSKVPSLTVDAVAAYLGPTGR